MKTSTMRPLVFGLLLAGPLAAQGPSFLPFGEGCPGTYGTPLLTNWNGDLPRMGTDLTLDLRNLPPSGFAIGLIGLPEVIDPGGMLTLPLDGTPFGAPGCTLYTSVRAQHGLVIEGGRSIWEFRIPGDPRLLGFRFYQQALVMDPAANSLGWIMSNAAMSVVGDLPDLTIASGLPTVSPRTIHPGGWVDVSAVTIKNDSFFVPSGEFDSGWLLSTSPLVSRDSTVLYRRSEANLNPRQSRTMPARSVRIPPGTPAGTYYLAAYADIENTVEEWNEFLNSANRAITVTAPLTPLPDLTFPDGTPGASPSSVLPGESVDIASYVLANQGNYPATTFDIGVYLSPFLNDLQGGALLDNYIIPGLVQGLPRTISARSVVIPPDTPPGNYWLAFVADRTEQVSELDETNNSVARLITVRPLPTLPDLYFVGGVGIDVTDPIVTPLLGLPRPVQLDVFWLSNQGTTPSGPFKMGIYFSTDDNVTRDDHLIKTIDVPSLAPGEARHYLNLAALLPWWVPFGWWHMGAILDIEDDVVETNETNNRSQELVQIF